MLLNDPKDDLHRYLQAARHAVVWKLEGLSEYDARRPMTPTATNLLGLVKHLTAVEIGYFADTFGRAFGGAPGWYLDDDRVDEDMWATAEESRQEIVGRYLQVCAHADTTITELPLDAMGSVPWWPAERRQVTLQRILVHVMAETNRHAGHADILRETIDGSAGFRADGDNLAPRDAAGWSDLYERVERAARAARS